MTATDVTRYSRSYLATEESFGFVKEMQARNLIVPVIGDFGGPGALGASGITSAATADRERVLRLQRGGLSESRQTAAFCVNLARLPYNWSTYFIGSKGKQPLRLKLAGVPHGARGAQRPARFAVASSP